MLPVHIYLAGPIYGCTEGEAKDWRKYVADRLPAGIVGISPLRCEPMVGERYDTSSQDLCFGHGKAILAKNFTDLRRCDMTLAFFPADHATADSLESTAKFLGQYPETETMAEEVRRIARKSPQRSIGTIGEISWAFALQKPLVIVTNDPLIKAHPFTAEQPSWPVLPTLDDAIRLISGIYGAYTSGGKSI